MEKAKKIAGLILFLGMGFIMFIMISYVLRPRIDGSNRETFANFYEMEKNSLDIVTLGSSAIYRYLNNPVLYKEYGMTSYNLATSSQPIQTMEHIVDEIYKTQSPKLLIVEMRKFLSIVDKEGNIDGEMSETALRRVTNNMNYSHNRCSLINSTVPDWSNRMSYYFDIILYHDNWEMLDANALPLADNKDTFPLHNWENILKVDEIELLPTKEITDKTEISDVSEQVLRSFLEKCQRENVPVLFISTPWSITKKKMRQNNYMSDIIREYGFEYLDCNLLYEEIGLDPQTDFYNKRHTNVWGSEKFTKYLGAYIQERYAIEAAHTDSVVKKWNQFVKNSEEDLKIQIENQSSEEVNDFE